MIDACELWAGGPVFRQDAGAKLSTDSVLLADFVKLHGAERGIDLGCGAGILSLLLLCSSETLHMTGLELREEAAALARENLARNGFGERSEILTGDIREHRSLFAHGSFHLAVANPPGRGPGRSGTVRCRSSARRRPFCCPQGDASAWSTDRSGWRSCSCACVKAAWSPSECALSPPGPTPRQAWCWRRAAGAEDRVSLSSRP